ncbi:hypothetical protein NS506_01241 [Nocardia seriolae]|uniref:Protein-glutamine gamma-glutamyltransferase-like C-terminal domain-containing protein n=1 Tax=Nocardia seriolae TaxID=37332 RepID=A0ABC8AMX5_9NOCA|nr:DUF4129 domain-containing protein [Nocardia seriolae]APA95314.1 hypothetical protein NS506_01241 [Nocardia seriolae]
MTGVGTVAARAIGLIALVMLAVVALRGYIPGTGGPATPHPSSAVSLALMPVLLLVSMVILVAGVVNSQHRLPLAMPEPDRENASSRLGLRRIGLLVLIGIAGIALIVTAVISVYLVTPERQSEVGQQPAAGPTGSTLTPETVATAPDTVSAPPLTGTALLLVGIGAGVLVFVAMTGLIVVAVGSGRAPSLARTPLPKAVPGEAVSLAKVAEMGLAAMIAPGQDPRTAIIACYVAMERGLATVREVAPLASDTPSEVLARAFDRGFLHDASARELVALFEEARFSPHSMLEWQRMRAEQLLRIVLADLQGQAA